MSDALWMPLLNQCVADSGGSYSKAGARLGISRAAASTLHRGCYPSPKPEKIGQKIIDAMSRVECPHLGQWIAGTECRDHREAECPTGNARAVRHWRACQGCAHNPKARQVATREAAHD